MIDYSANQYHRERHSDFLECYELRKAWAYVADIAYFSHVKAKDRVLEYGGGLGYNLLVVKDRAFCCMLEPSPLGREVASNDGLQRVIKSLDDIKGEKFDTILCRHVLEHVPNPRDVLGSLLNHLTTGGTLVIVVPCESMNKFPKVNDLNCHLFCWSPRTLGNLLDVSGYENVTIKYEYFGGKKKLIPIYAKFGGKLYAKMVRLVGRLFLFKEIVATCQIKT